MFFPDRPQIDRPTCATMDSSRFDDAIVARILSKFRLLLSLSPGHLADHHVGPFRFGPESSMGRLCPESGLFVGVVLWVRSFMLVI